jgi:hypothetical protein
VVAKPLAERVSAHLAGTSGFPSAGR